MSNDKVVHIAGGSPQDDAPVNDEAVEYLEDLLARFKTGEYYSLAMVASGEHHTAIMASGLKGQEPRFKGMLIFLSEEISEGIRAGLRHDPGEGA